MISVLLRTIKWVDMNRETIKSVLVELERDYERMIENDEFKDKNSFNWPRPQKAAVCRGCLRVFEARATLLPRDD